MKIITDERCTGFNSPGHPERPTRISRTIEYLRRQKDLVIEWDIPANSVSEEAILRAHTRQHLQNVKSSIDAFDSDTPAHQGIFDHARRSAEGALTALSYARKGTNSFSLLRPPGHHALQDRAMGFCYFNSIAIAVLKAIATGVKRVAVFDFDVHHGNGTEAILRGNPAASFFSIHQHPCYPGTGVKDVGPNCFNYPVSPRTPREQYRKVLQNAIDDLKKSKPELVAVSAGFDAYARDPLAQETLEAEDFYWIGKSLCELSKPVFSILEGGYSDDLPELILSYLRGIEGK